MTGAQRTALVLTVALGIAAEAYYLASPPYRRQRLPRVPVPAYVEQAPQVKRCQAELTFDRWLDCMHIKERGAPGRFHSPDYRQAPQYEVGMTRQDGDRR